MWFKIRKSDIKLKQSTLFLEKNIQMVKLVKCVPCEMDFENML